MTEVFYLWIRCHRLIEVKVPHALGISTPKRNRVRLSSASERHVRLSLLTFLTEWAYLQRTGFKQDCHHKRAARLKKENPEEAHRRDSKVQQGERVECSDCKMISRGMACTKCELRWRTLAWRRCNLRSRATEGHPEARCRVTSQPLPVACLARLLDPPNPDPTSVPAVRAVEECHFLAIILQRKGHAVLHGCSRQKS